MYTYCRYWASRSSTCVISVRSLSLAKRCLTAMFRMTTQLCRLIDDCDQILIKSGPCDCVCVSATITQSSYFSLRPIASFFGCSILPSLSSCLLHPAELSRTLQCRQRKMVSFISVTRRDIPQGYGGHPSTHCMTRVPVPTAAAAGTSGRAVAGSSRFVLCNVTDRRTRKISA